VKPGADLGGGNRLTLGDAPDNMPRDPTVPR
jgi:hypothetical protein